MVRTVGISGYRSLRELVVSLDRLNLITGANGSGKSSVYRALGLLRETALNAVVGSLAREGGLPSVLWAGPDQVRSDSARDRAKTPSASRKPAQLRLGFAGDVYGYSIELGHPSLSRSAFSRDPEIKHECIWHGERYRKASVLVDRKGPCVALPRDGDGAAGVLTTTLHQTDSMLTGVADLQRAPEMLAVREAIRGWRFYDGFRTDWAAPMRTPQVGTFTPVLSHDGADLAAALQTIQEIGDWPMVVRTVADAFPGCRVGIQVQSGRFELEWEQTGLLRALTVGELSDGTLRFLAWTAALLTPRPPELMVLNEPESGLHADLLSPLARLIAAAAARSQIVVVSHARTLVDELLRAPGCRHLHLEKVSGETVLAGKTLLDGPSWEWPPR